MTSRTAARTAFFAPRAATCTGQPTALGFRWLTGLPDSSSSNARARSDSTTSARSRRAGRSDRRSDPGSKSVRRRRPRTPAGNGQREPGCLAAAGVFDKRKARLVFLDLAGHLPHDWPAFGLRATKLTPGLYWRQPAGSAWNVAMEMGHSVERQINTVAWRPRSFSRSSCPPARRATSRAGNSRRAGDRLARRVRLGGDSSARMFKRTNKGHAKAAAKATPLSTRRLRSCKTA